MATERRTYPSINALRDFVQAELEKRKKGSLAVPTPIMTPFVRMTSAIEDPVENYRFFSIGLHGITDRELEGNLFDLTYGNQDVVGFAYDTSGFSTTVSRGGVVGGEGDTRIIRSEIEEGTRDRRKPIQSTQSPETKEEVPAEGKHPIPGITNIAVNYKGINDVINVEVSWKCYNSTQLDFLRNHFLLFGQFVVVDFGHIISNRINSEPLRPFDFAAEDAVVKLAKYETGGRLAIVDGKGGLDALVEQNNGNYDIFIGKIENSTISLQPDNTYECKTNIVSTGEVIYGATHHSLVADLARELTTEEKNKYVVTIEEFFENGGTLEAEIGAASNVLLKDAAGQTAVIDAFHRERSTDRINHPKLSADQFVYVSWNYFTHTIIPAMFSVLQNQVVNAEIDFFTTIGQPVIDVASTTSPKQRPGESLIGNHPILTSVDHKTLIIVKEASRKLDRTKTENKIALFEDANEFSDEKNHYDKGYLSRGVYLNVEAIRESFLNQRTFYDGMAALLRRMNNATANYWKLDIGFDEETKKVYIFDQGSVAPDFPEIPPVYLFNEGAEGELLGMDFSAEFSDELKTSIMISARTKGQGQFAGATTAAQASTAFGPNRSGQMLNVNNLTDVLQTAINELAEARREDRIALLDRLLDRSLATKTEHADNVRQTRIDLQDERERQRVLAEQETVEGFENELKKFTNELEWYVQIPSSMKGRIAAHGITHPDVANNYISPIATEINCQITVMGLSGIAFWDNFMIDKLPRQYRNHGVFLVNGLSHDISRDGWTTQIKGLYYFLWQSGQQGKRMQSIQEVEEEVSTPQELVTIGSEKERIREARRKRAQEFEDEFNQLPYLEKVGRLFQGGIGGG